MRTALALALLLLTLGGCEGSPGTSSAAFGEAEFSSTSASFSLRYLSPPWSFVESGPSSLELEIPAQIFGVGLEGSPPTHVFQMSHVDAPGGIDGILEDGGAASAGTDGGPGADELAPPDYLLNVNLASPHAVALAELNHLVETQGAQLDSSTVAFEVPDGTTGVVWRVQVEPGFYVRSFYFPSEPTVVRATFGSLFNVETEDVDTMVASFSFGTDATR